MLWMPCRYNTFYGRLLWFDGVEGKRGLTLTVFACLFVVVVVVVVFVCVFLCFCCCLFLLLLCFFGGGGGGAGGRRVKLFHCIVRTGVYGIL